MNKEYIKVNWMGYYYKNLKTINKKYTKTEKNICMYKKIKSKPKKLQKYAKNIIPGLSQLFGKRPDLYLPGGEWPTYYKKAKGIEVWGVDNKRYNDFTMVGIGTSVLGYCDPDINRAAAKGN